MTKTSWTKTGLIHIREGVQDDWSFIYSSWRRGLFYGNKHPAGIDEAEFMRNTQEKLERIMKDSRTDIRVACLIEDPSVIVGYAVTAPSTLHWVYVKKDWRQIGLAKALVPPGTQTATHLSKLGERLKPSHWSYNPFV